MSSVLNRATRQYLASVNTPDFPVQDWIHNPDLSAVVGQPSRYWVITLDVVTLMTQPQRDAVDAALLTASRDGLVTAYDDIEGQWRALVLVLLDELNAHAAKMNAILTAIDTSTNYATLKTNIGTVADYPTRNVGQIKTAVRGKLGT